MADSIPTQMENELNYDKVEPELSYKLAPSSDAVLHRRSMTLAPSSGGGTITGGSSTAIRFKIRSGDFIDPQSIYMTCDYQQSKVNDDATNRAEPPNGGGCLIKELRIRSGTGSQIETIREAGLLNNILQNYSMSKTHIETAHTNSGGGLGYRVSPDSGATVDATSSLTNEAINYLFVNDRMGAVADTDEKITFHLPSGFLHSCGKYLDTGALKGLVIEIELYANATVFNVSGTGSGATYQISNPEIHYDELKVSGAYMKAYQSALVNGLNVAYNTYTHSSSQGGDSVRISRSVSRLKDIISCVRLTNDTADETKDSLDTFKAFPNTARYNYQIGSESFPVSQVKSTTQAYMEALKVFARNKDSYCGNITRTQFATNKAIVCVDCELNQGGAFSGIKTTQNPDILLLSNNVSDSNDLVDTFLHHERVLRFTNGSVEVLE